MVKLIDCPDCLFGNKVTGVTRSRSRVISVAFSLKEKCPTCAGTGKALVRRSVVYSGRPDLGRSALSSKEQSDG